MAKIVYKGQTVHAETSFNNLPDKPKINGRILGGGDNTASQLGIVWHGTQAEYDALPTKEASCIYVIQNEKHTPMVVDVTGKIVEEYQLRRDLDLQTEAEYVVQAINEVNERVGDMTDVDESLVQTINDAAETIGDRQKLVTSNKDRIVYATNEVDAHLGDITQLTTTNKTNVVAAINEIDGDVGVVKTLTTSKKTDAVAAISEINNDAGSASGLSTASKTNIVSAVNEVNKDIGTLSSLTTTAKGSIVAAINETTAEIGDLTKLQTTKKDNIVNAINEAKTKTIKADCSYTITGEVTIGASAYFDRVNYFGVMVAQDIAHVHMSVKCIKNYNNQQLSLTPVFYTSAGTKKPLPGSVLWGSQSSSTRSGGLIGYTASAGSSQYFFVFSPFGGYAAGEILEIDGYIRLG